jgi:predicted ferric reductase
VFVCGAPEMNETFDRAFEELQVELRLDEANIEIM